MYISEIAIVVNDDSRSSLIDKAYIQQILPAHTCSKAHRAYRALRALHLPLILGKDVLHPGPPSRRRRLALVPEQYLSLASSSIIIIVRPLGHPDALARVRVGRSVKPAGLVCGQTTLGAEFARVALDLFVGDFESRWLEHYQTKSRSIV